MWEDEAMHQTVVDFSHERQMVKQLLLLGAYAIQVSLLTFSVCAAKFLLRHEEILMAFLGLGWMVSLAFFVVGHALRNTRTQLIHVFCAVIFVPTVGLELFAMLFAWAWSASANFG
jgi:uncharacterized membrane protein